MDCSFGVCFLGRVAENLAIDVVVMAQFLMCKCLIEAVARQVCLVSGVEVSSEELCRTAFP